MLGLYLVWYLVAKMNARLFRGLLVVWILSALFGGLVELMPLLPPILAITVFIGTICTVAGFLIAYIISWIIGD